MLKPIKTRYYLTLLQMLVVLFLLGVLVLLNKDQVTHFFYSTQAGQLGLVLNGVILLIFLIGLVRMILMFLGFTREQEVLQRFLKRVEEGAPNPTHDLPDSAMIVDRYRAVQTIARQHAEVNQAALASTLAASQSTQFTLVRFVHNILILSGVFGTVVSLSIALMGAAGLLNSPENMQQMGTIVGGMSNALSTTITAIVCYVFFAYFHLRLQDARTQLLANVENLTTLYILPRFKHAENSMLHDVAVLTAELRRAAEAIHLIQDRFLHAGERLQLAADDLQTAVAQSGSNIQVIRDSIREGFRLDDKPKG
ncbi:MAG: MotA/TolQ/ExbB proton channel family protein [Thiothrix sp.]